MGPQRTSVTSLDEVINYGLHGDHFLNVTRPTSCRNSPLLPPKHLAKNVSPMNRSEDSYLAKFAASIESMQESSDFMEKLFLSDAMRLTQHRVSGDIASDNEESWKDKLGAGLSDSGENLNSPFSASSIGGDSKFEYNAEEANLWVELTKIDMSPVLPQRKSRTFCESARHVLNKIDPLSLQRYPLSPQPQRANPLHEGITYSKSSSDLNEESVLFKFQYLIVTERLKVTVIKASNMFKGEKPSSEVNTYAEVCLMPGKLQKQISKLTKASANPVFDYIVYFHGISLFEMHQMCLRIKIMAKERLLKTPRILGEVTVSLDDFDLVSETVLEENLNTRIGTRSGSRYGGRSKIVQ